MNTNKDLAADLARTERERVIRTAVREQITQDPLSFAAHLDLFMDAAKAFMAERQGSDWREKHSVFSFARQGLRIESNLAEAIFRLEHVDDEIQAKFQIR